MLRILFFSTSCCDPISVSLELNNIFICRIQFSQSEELPLIDEIILSKIRNLRLTYKIDQLSIYILLQFNQRWIFMINCLEILKDRQSPRSQQFDERKELFLCRTRAWSRVMGGLSGEHLAPRGRHAAQITMIIIGREKLYSIIIDLLYVAILFTVRKIKSCILKLLY